MYENTNGVAKDRLIGNISAKYKITDDLNFMVRGGRDFFSDRKSTRLNSSHIPLSRMPSSAWKKKKKKKKKRKNRLKNMSVSI